MRSRFIPLNVPADIYQRLEQRAKAEERTPTQQSLWLLRQALDEPRPPEREPVAAGVVATPAEAR